MKLTHFPSGEKLGELALPTRAMRATAAVRPCDLVPAGAVFWPVPCPNAATPRQLINATIEIRSQLGRTIMMVFSFPHWTDLSDFRFNPAILALYSVALCLCTFSQAPPPHRGFVENKS
jgi:hypothetical protein